MKIVIVAGVLMVIVFVFAKQVLISMGATETILPYALEYAHVFIISMFFILLNSKNEE